MTPLHMAPSSMRKANNGVTASQRNRTQSERSSTNQLEGLTDHPPLARGASKSSVQKAQPSLLVSVVFGQLWQHAVAIMADSRNVGSVVIFIVVHCFATYISTSESVRKGTLHKFFPVLLAATPAVLLPWYTSYTLIIRAFHGLATVIMLLRQIQLVNDPEHFDGTGFLYRLTFKVWVGSDYRTSKKLSGPERKTVLDDCTNNVFFALAGCVVCQAALESGTALAVGGRGLRWAAGTCFMYNSMVMLDAVYRLPLLYLDAIDVLPCMRRPVAAASLKEFWAVRWDKAVQMLLVDTVYRPVRALAPKSLAIAATFAASGLLHVYPLFLVGLPSLQLLKMFLFFAVQPLLLVLEDQLGGAMRWPYWIAPFLATTPLFIEPFLDVFGW